MAKHCDCHDPVSKGSHLDHLTRGVARKLVDYCSTHACSQSEAIARLNAAPGRAVALGRSQSKVVGSRVPLAQYAKIKITARAMGTTPGQLIRRALDSAFAGGTPQDPQSLLGQIAADLGLDPSASPADVVKAVQALCDGLDAAPAPANAAPKPGKAAPANAAPPAPPAKQYSREVLAHCKKLGITLREFEAAKARSVRRIG